MATVARYKHTGDQPNSMIGQRVRFSAPGDVKKKGGQSVFGRIEDEVWSLEEDGAPEASKQPSEFSWGDYCFFAQLIKWDNGNRSVRLGYYRRRKGEPNWTFGSQTTISSDPGTIKKLLDGTIAKSSWFECGPRGG